MAEKKRFRSLEGPYRVLEKTIGMLIPITGVVFIINIPLFFGISLFNQQFLGLFLGLLLALVFLILPPWPSSSREELPWYDLLFCLLSIAIGIYIFLTYPSLIGTIGLLTPFRTILGTIMILLVIEGTRRLSGWTLVVVIAVFILYFKFGYLLSGVLQVNNISFSRMISQLFLGADAIYGVALRIAAMVVFGFILFAQVLFSTGGANFVFGIAEALMGRFRGGTAKAGIMASTLFGLLTGSAVANVAATGPLTIPLMKKAGYEPYFAAAVNSVASTGAVISPPIMGAAAFIIAEFLRVPYAEVVYIAIVPAVLYYLSLFIQVDLRAAKDKIQGVPVDQLPSIGKTIKEGWFFIFPLLVLIFCIFFLYLRPETAALYALASVIIIGVLKKETRDKLKNYVTIMETTSRGMLEVAVICGAAGLIIGVMSYSGLGLTVSRLLTELAGNNLLVLSLMTAIACIIIGLGMPVTAAYLLLALLVVPAMVEMGVPPIAAHMFVFYFGAYSFITPPVCLAVFAASAIAGADFMKTSVQAMKLAIPGFIVPFLFIFNPPVALIGTPGEIVREIFFAIIAVFSISVFLEGFLKIKLSMVHRLLFLLVSASLFLPFSTMVSIIAAISFVVITVILYIIGGKQQQLG